MIYIIHNMSRSPTQNTYFGVSEMGHPLFSIGILFTLFSFFFFFNLLTM